MATAPKQVAELSVKEEVKSALAEMGIEELTPVQTETIPPILAGKDVIVHSQTGSGKTLAFMIPTINSIELQIHTVQLLIIAPTRELCLQIAFVAEQLGSGTGVSSGCFIGGQSIDEDRGRLGVQIAVGTPGRLLELLHRETKSFKSVRYLILDESDKLLSFGFETKLLEILKLLPKNRTTCLLSATTNDATARLARHYLRNPTQISVRTDPPAGLRMRYIKVPPDAKLNVLLELIQNKRSIIFFATCAQVDFYSELLSRLLKRICLKIHGKMDQKERSKVYSQFENADAVLMCTDVAARGIDFKDVDLVIHFDVPKDYSNIIHRSGRTARGGGVGESILFLMPSEEPYIKFLSLKSIFLEAFETDIDSTAHQFKSVMDEELLRVAVRAFVSYIRSYKEHILNYVLDLKALDYDGLAELFFLEKIPRMKELREIKFKKFQRKENRCQ